MAVYGTGEALGLVHSGGSGGWVAYQAQNHPGVTVGAYDDAGSSYTGSYAIGKGTYVGVVTSSENSGLTGYFSETSIPSKKLGNFYIKF